MMRFIGFAVRIALTTGLLGLAPSGAVLARTEPIQGPEDLPSVLIPDQAPSRRDAAGIPRMGSPDPSEAAREEGTWAPRARKPAKALPRQRPRGAPECRGATPIHEHAVVSGENLGQIAGRYGVRRTDLLRLNDFANPNLIRPGQRVRVCPQIPPRERVQVVHEIAPGETLVAIANRYELTAAELLAFQHGRISDPNRIRVGQLLTFWRDGEVLPDFRPQPARTDRLQEGVQLPSSRHYRVKHPRLAYGTPRTIELIQRAVQKYVGNAKRRNRITIGDISRRGGGPIPPHVSHQNGRDVDVGYVLRDIESSTRGGSRIGLEARIDVEDTWILIKSFLDTEAIEYIFVDLRIQRLLHQHAMNTGESAELLDELFQYPRRHRAHGIIRHWPGHDDHFHVRFR